MASLESAYFTIAKLVKNFKENAKFYLDCQIDQLVYELYGLTEEEIRIVEGENNN